MPSSSKKKAKGASSPQQPSATASKPPPSAPAAAPAGSDAKANASQDGLKAAMLEEANFLGIFPFPMWPVRLCILTLAVAQLLSAAYQAYRVRLWSSKTYGYLIHEFDPWFNYRATEYLEQHGWTAFFHWFDYMSWYPLGRPVGTTIYPGLQITGVAIYRALQAMGSSLTLTQVCVLIPAWFGAIATLLLGAMTYEATRSMGAAAVAAYLFSIVPAHTMRSMSGEFDNECIALAAMLLTFYLWMRSLRTQASWPIGVLTGLAYGYMVAAWGGYIFVLNMVALHAGMSALLDWASGTYNRGLLRAYTLFFVIGTAIATRVPPVSMAPFKSLEQLSALLVFIFLWGLEIAEHLREKAKVEKIRSRRTLRIRARVFMCIGAAMLAVAVCLAPTGYFGPLSSRVRALFVAHTRTGNPLVDSVAEHQPTAPEAFKQYLSVNMTGWGVGFLVTLASALIYKSPAKLFVLLYSFAAYYFSQRMTRLIILAGPVACLMTGTVVGMCMEGALRSLFWKPAAKPQPVDSAEEREEALLAAAAKKTDGDAEAADAAAGGTGDASLSEKVKAAQRRVAARAAKKAQPLANSMEAASHSPLVEHVRSSLSNRPYVTAIALCILTVMVVPSVFSPDYWEHCVQFSQAVANPMIVFRARLHSGQEIMVDDYLKAYLWLREKTPQDARVLSWWDYGYQITGIGNRTTLADGNTWNHEHIATLGKMLTSPIEEAHSLVRHLADYVLIWAGQGSSDLMKSPHMARIGNSVYRDICPKDPLCRHFGFAGGIDRPTRTMRHSLLYNLHENGKHGVTVDPTLFQEVYTSRYGLVRIYKVMNVSLQSKRWLADPANRVCDHPGSWICPGQYPPAKPIQEMLAKRIDFGQIEDFNRKRKDDEYHQAYMAQRD